MKDPIWVDLKVSAEDMGQLNTWARKCADYRDGKMTGAQVIKWAEDTEKNNFNVTLTRIRRYIRTAGVDDRRDDHTWCTIAAELGLKKSDTSPLAIAAKDAVYAQIRKRGHKEKEVYVDWHVGTTGVITISIKISNLREFMKRQEEKKTKKTDNAKAD